MQIDWFTLLAQIVNFLLLVWLLKHFLYGRVVRAMDEREAKSPPGWRRLHSSGRRPNRRRNDSAQKQGAER